MQKESIATTGSAPRQTCKRQQQIYCCHSILAQHPPCIVTHTAVTMYLHSILATVLERPQNDQDGLAKTMPSWQDRLGSAHAITRDQVNATLTGSDHGRHGARGSQRNICIT